MDDLKTAIQIANNFYIHLDKRNIGKRANNNATINFNQQKEAIKIKVINQYKDLFNYNITTDGASIEVLSAAMGFTEQKFLSQINKDLTEKLQKEINVEKLSKLHQIVSEGDISNLLKQAINKDNVKALSNVLKTISKALRLLETGNGSLGAVVLNSIEGATSNKELGANLLEALEKYKVNNNYRTVKSQSLEAAKQQLNNLGLALKTGYFASTGSKLSVEGLKTLLLNNLISTAIAEGLGFSMNFKAGNLLYDTIISAVGTQQTKVESDFRGKGTITGKTDIKIDNVQWNLEAIDRETFGALIQLNLGISQKFYTGQKFNAITNKDGNQSLLSQGNISSGSGGTLGEAISAIFDSPAQKYLVYNFFPHQMYQEELNDLILKRQILRLFATNSSFQDFSQFIFINGQIISIWEVLQYALNTELKFSNSMKESKNEGLVLSIPNRPDIIQANKYIDYEKNESPIKVAWKRSQRVNSKINSATIYAKMHLKNLLNGYQKIMTK